MCGRLLGITLGITGAIRLTRLSEIMPGAGGTAFGASAALTGRRLHVPERAHVRDGVLEWSAAYTLAEIRTERSSDACLRQFIRLANAPPQKIAEFAKRHGPLHLGTHGLPVAEINDLPSRRDDDEPPRKFGVASGHPLLIRRKWFQEPIEGWRAWARFVGTIVVLAYEVRNGERIVVPERRLRAAGLDPGPPNPMIEDDSPFIRREEDGSLSLSLLGRAVYQWLWPWTLIHDLGECKTADEQWKTIAAHAAVISHEVNYAASLAGTRSHPTIELGPPTRRFDFGAPLRVDSVFPTISGQMLATITGGSHTHRCTDCQLPYPVKRRRANGRCPECRMIARSASVQRSKAKSRAVQRGSIDGNS